MHELTLIIGNKNYSSWSLRPWFLMRQAGIPFHEVRLPLFTPEWYEKIGHHSPSGRVPVLRDGDLVVWDSLSICEYLAERFPEAALWPRDARQRAHARSVACEMHSGFGALRSALPMNCRARHRVVAPTPEVDRDVARIAQIWSDCRTRYGGEGSWLFGSFSIADAMFAPVASRFATYDIEVSGVVADYRDTLLESEPYRDWLAAGEAEIEVIPVDEAGAAVA
jgi:glutathione S-transferase